ncbi:MAG: hypothetical protein ACC660_00035 [Acidimicrobiales bacterium]
MAEFESPVLKEYPTGGGDLQLADMSATTKLLVRSDLEQFGVGFGASAHVGEALVCGSRPGEWLLMGEAGDCAGAADRVNTGGFTNVIDHTHSRALFRLTGARATSVLEKLCGLDWTDSMTPDGAVVSASVAKVNSDIIRNDTGIAGNATGGQPSYLIACDRSFGQYLFDVLMDAGTEFDLTVTS